MNYLLGAAVIGDFGTGTAPSAPFDTPAQTAARKAKVEEMAQRPSRGINEAFPESTPAWKWALGALGVLAAGTATWMLSRTYTGMSSEEAARAHREFHLARGEWT